MRPLRRPWPCAPHTLSTSAGRSAARRSGRTIRVTDTVVSARNASTLATHDAEHLEAQLADPDLGRDPEDFDRLDAARRNADAAFRSWQATVPQPVSAGTD